MANLPLIQIPQGPLQAAPSPRMDADAMAAPWRATAELGRSVTQAAGVVASFDERSRAAQAAGQFAAAKTGFNVTLTETQRMNENEPDPNLWPERLRENLDIQYNELISNPSLTPEAKQQIDQYYAEFTAQSIADMRFSAQRRMNDNAKADILSYADSALQSGSLEGYMAEIDNARSLGLLSNKEYNRLRDQAHQKYDYMQVSSLIEENPKAAREALTRKDADGNFVEYTNLQPDTRRALIGHSRRRTSDAQTAFYSDISYQAVRNNMTPTIEQIDQWYQDGRLTNGQATDLIRKYHPSQDRDASLDARKYVDLRSEIESYDPAGDPTGERQAKLWERISLTSPRQYEGSLQRLMESQLKTGSSSITQAQKDARDYISNLRNTGRFGDMEMFGGRPVNQPSYEQAYSMEAQLKDALDAAFLRDPNMTRADAIRFINQNIGETVNQGPSVGPVPIYNDARSLNEILRARQSARAANQ